MLGYTEHELISKTVKGISHPDDAHLTDGLRDRLRAGALESFKIEKRYIRKDGTPLWVGLTVATRRDRSGAPLYDVSIVDDISVRKKAEERVEYLATHDSLTGLPNRAMFDQLLALATETARRYDRHLAVLYIDLDRFKIVNDSLGHEAGDVLLREIASRLRECLRTSDVVARLGGDEFIVLVPEVGDATEAATVARIILSAIMRPIVILGQECRVISPKTKARTTVKCTRTRCGCARRADSRSKRTFVMRSKGTSCRCVTNRRCSSRRAQSRESKRSFAGQALLSATSRRFSSYPSPRRRA
jgi:diguanylate cyclase (GGDEF)-like protein/PAS domain S-box-containing protein